MNLNSLHALLAQAAVSTNASGTATQTQDDPRAVLAKNVLLMVALFAIAYFVLIRPQSKKAKEQAVMLKTVKPGDKIITSSGIVGTVVAVKEKTISLRSAETKLEVLKSAVSDITERSGESSAAE